MTMPALDKQQQKLANILSYLPPTHSLPPKMARPIFTLLDRLTGIKKVDVGEVKNINIATHGDNQSISLRMYYPTKSAAQYTHAMMYFHGGGCVIGSIQSHDRLCRYLAQHTNTVIISVGYRLAPEYKFPIPILDAIESWNWLQSHKDELGLSQCEIGAGGDSAGAYLALLLGLPSVQHTLPIQTSCPPEFQYLLYPMVDLQGLTASYRSANDGMLLTNKLMDYFRDHYLVSRQQMSLPLVSPLLIDELSELPKTYLLTVEFDPLKDDGIAFANKLKAQSVAVHHQHFDDCMHSFVSTTRVSQRAQQGVEEISRQLKDLCST
jgi:acetyl esterase